MAGRLLVVATPIGHLGDVTFRAVEALKSVALIACEDTRQTKKLLDHYGMQTPMISYTEENHARRVPVLLQRLRGGEDVALVSDAGTPSVSDPGTRLVQAAIAAGADVQCLPGPAACLAALVVSGLPTERFTFEGFLPRKAGPRRRRLAALASEGRTAVIYESPYRVHATLQEILETCGDLPASYSRELTKRFEETRRGPVSELLQHVTVHPPKGECVLVFHSSPRAGSAQ